MRRNLPGFTLMELLIVIGVLGILAAGLLAAIDPFEQLKKARDTNYRNATIELMGSLQRFYANHGDFPWNMSSYSAICGRGQAEALDGLDDITIRALTIQNSNLKDCIMGSLVPDGELKSTFFDGVGGKNIYIGSAVGNRTDLVVCFEPEAMSSKNDSSTKYLVNTIGNSGWYFVAEQTGVPPLNACTRQLGDCAQCFK